jgi:hypothetical protein
MILWIILWYISGVLLGLLGSAIHDGEITVRDLLLSLTIGGGLGLLMLIPLMVVFMETNSVKDIILWKRK